MLTNNPRKNFKIAYKLACNINSYYSKILKSVLRYLIYSRRYLKLFYFKNN